MRGDLPCRTQLASLARGESPGSDVPWILPPEDRGDCHRPIGWFCQSGSWCGDSLMTMDLRDSGKGDHGLSFPFEEEPLVKASGSGRRASGWALAALLYLATPVVAMDVHKGAPGTSAAADAAKLVEKPLAKPAPCTERSSSAIHHLENNGGVLVLSLERRSWSCWPVYSESKILVRSPAGMAVAFSSRLVQKGPGRASTEDGRNEVQFPDGSTLELKYGSPVVVPPGLSPEFPGSRFLYKGAELVFTAERPVKPVWTSKEGKAFRALLPEGLDELMQALADGAKALADEGVFGGSNELFVSLYLGEEVGSLGRDGYSVIEVAKEHRAGEKAARVDAFPKKEASGVQAEPASGGGNSAAGPRNDSQAPEVAGEEGPPREAPLPTPSPTPEADRRQFESR